MYCTSKFFCI